MINELARKVHQNAVDRGFWVDGDRDLVLAQKLALIHSEVSEALEAAREGEIYTTFNENDKPEGVGSELADVIIRVLDLAEFLGFDMEWEIARKANYNSSRSYKHGKRF